MTNFEKPTTNPNVEQPSPEETRSEAPVSLKDMPHPERMAAVEDRDATPETLAELADDEDWRIRYIVADHPNTTAETLLLLARDEEWNVRYAVALNPNTPAEALRILAEREDEEWVVLRAVAQHGNTPSDILDILGDHENEFVKNAARGNPNYLDR